MDSSEIAFKIAGSMALKEGVRRAKPVLLEPIMKLEIFTPEQFLGEVLGDIDARRAHIEGVETQGDMRVIQCFVPLGETFGYTTILRSLSQGKATQSMEFHHYEELPPGLTEPIIGRIKGRAA